MGDQIRLHSLEDLPSHVILEILTSGRLSSADLACLELTSRLFGGSHGFMHPHKFMSLVDFAAFQLCISHPVYARKVGNSQRELFDRCSGNWKRVLRFLQGVEQCSNAVETSVGKIQNATGRYHTLLIRNSSVYSCGSRLCGPLVMVLRQQCVTFTRINFPSLVHVVQVSSSHNLVAFVMQSGEDVFLRRGGGLISGIDEEWLPYQVQDSNQ